MHLTHELGEKIIDEGEINKSKLQLVHIWGYIAKKLPALAWQFVKASAQGLQTSSLIPIEHKVCLHLKWILLKMEIFMTKIHLKNLNEPENLIFVEPKIGLSQPIKLYPEVPNIYTVCPTVSK